MYRSKLSFKLTVQTNKGALTLPQQPNDGITLNGRQSKVVVTDYSFGNSGKLLYSTASILFAGRIGAQDVIFLHNDLDASSEIAFDDKTTIHVGANSLKPGLHVLSENTRRTFGPLVLYSDPQTAATFWAPIIPSTGDLGAYWQFGSNQTILVGGPQLVRNATISRSGQLALRGDLNASTALTLVVSETVKTVSWNGETVHVKQNANVPGMLTAQLSPKYNLHSVKLPELTDWKFKDSLPEVQANFDDSHWIIADHTTTNITLPLFGDGRVLYGECNGFLLRRLNQHQSRKVAITDCVYPLELIYLHS